VVLAGLAIALLSPASASAGTVYIVDAAPTASGYIAPYGTVTVDLLSSTEATITLQAVNSGGNYYLFSHHKLVGLNFNGPIAQNAHVTSYASPQSDTPTFQYNYGGATVGGHGVFNFSLDNGSNPGKSGVSQLVLDVHLASGSWSSSDSVLTPNAKGYSAVGHVYPYQSSNYTAASGGNNFFAAADGGPTDIAPAPPSALLLGLGALGLGGRRLVRSIRGRWLVAA
jgi:hypothetical protein